MKNASKVRKQAGTKPALLQAKTSRQAKTSPAITGKVSVPESNDPDLPMDGGCLLFYGENQQRILASVPVSFDQLADMEHKSATAGFSLESYINLGFGIMLEKLEGKIAGVRNEVAP